MGPDPTPAAAATGTAGTGEPVVPTDAPAPVTAPPAPVRVAVPVLGLDEPLIELGVDDDGAAEVPADYDAAGWFAPGGRPGAVGPTVLMGHVDSTTGPAVFHRLTELAPGDRVDVGLADGGTASYRVTAVDRYPKDVFPTFAVFGATLDDVLRLVTCGGEFDRDAGSYRENLVVTAVRA